MISIIIPAHNEASVIRRGLESCLTGAEPGEVEAIVVCNGCSDETAEIARAFKGPVTVIETDVPSKSNALNLGDAAAKGFPRIYMDADVTMSLASVRALAGVLQRGEALAAAPAVDTAFMPGAAWSVRAYYAFWMSLPFIKEGMMAAGVYALSEAGHARLGRFPDVIADDGYVRLLFTAQERVEVPGAVSTVRAPAVFGDLIKIKTRSRLGVFQLRDRFPELFSREQQSKNYGQALASILRQPGLYMAAFPFLAVSVISRLRAQRQHRARQAVVWERDTSSRA